MAEIDWSKAPEDATHYYPGCDAYYSHWIKCVDEKRYAALTAAYPWKKDTDPRSLNQCIPRPTTHTQPEWGGEGLPPVGTVCECQDESFKWKPGTIVYVGQGDGAMVAVMQADSGILIGEKGEFRPILTLEQIAAEEREKAIEDLIRVTCINHGEAARIYDAGYRKVKP